MASPKVASTSGEPIAHMTYFRLVDRSAETIRKFIELCTTYLSGHEGQVYFSVGPRATEMTRDVNILTFDVAMNIIFDGLASYDKYRTNDRHLEFITQSVGMSTDRCVYDSYIVRDQSVSPNTTKRRHSSRA